MLEITKAQKERVGEIKDALAYLMELLSTEPITQHEVSVEFNDKLSKTYDLVDSVNDCFHTEIYADIDWDYEEEEEDD